MDCFAELSLARIRATRWLTMTSGYKGDSGSRRALRRAVETAADVLERTKLQRTEEAWQESSRITISASGGGHHCRPETTILKVDLVVERLEGPDVAAGQPSMTPRASLRRLAFTAGCR